MAVEQVFDHKFPSGTDVPLVGLRVRVVDLAARGCFVRLSTGRVILLRGLEYTITHLGLQGPLVHVDAGDAVVLGMVNFIAEVTAELGLSGELIQEMPEEPVVWRDKAARIVGLIQRQPRNPRG